MNVLVGRWYRLRFSLCLGRGCQVGGGVDYVLVYVLVGVAIVEGGVE